ncbi:MAG: hypothetical protein A2Z29_07550 [Chloroflexi bacterium RBG_16_56_11]|nr:MAG: hypothetical protein A2Z29_07550 [Chloroflexi bacterium RBG_16_56_11]
MEWQQLVRDSFRRQTQELEKVVEGLTKDDLDRQPVPECNSIGWLAWHVARSVDRNMSELMGEEQLWIKDGWHARFGREPDRHETGVGHTAEQAKAFKSPSEEVVMDYHKAILNRVEDYIDRRLTETDLAREVYSPTLEVTRTVEEILAGQFWHGMHHAGQAGYVRGLLKGKGWYGH